MLNSTASFRTNIKKYNSVEIKKGIEFDSIEFREDLLNIKAKKFILRVEYYSAGILHMSCLRSGDRA
jgi:hypothetical protein